MKIKAILLTIFVVFISSVISAETETQSDGNYLDRFHAHRIAERLSKDNIRDIEFIEIISKNFGYTNNTILRKEYWTANLMVTSGKIVKASKIFKQNRKNIDLALKRISQLYKKDTMKILQESISYLSSKKMETLEDNNRDNKDKLLRNQLRIKVAYEELRNAEQSFSLRQYKNSINLYRVVKKHAITVLKDLSNKKETARILNKYKIHIVDNRHEVYKRS